MQNKRAVIYCRVSTKEQVEEGNSLSTQEKLCRDYAFKNGYEIIERFIEQGESAKTANRTELQRLLSYCSDRKNQVTAVIAYKLDRISRNTDDYSQIRLLLKRYNVEIKSTSEYFENHTPAGKFMENIIANVSQFDNDVRTERSVNGMKDAVRDGRYVWKAPIGYSNVRITGRATIEQNEKAPLIKGLFQDIAKNIESAEKLRHRYFELGLSNRINKPICRTQFYYLLRNKLYTGWIHKFGEHHKGTFEPIISEELFEQVQWVLNGKRKKHAYKVKNPDFPLRRFVSHPDGFNLTGAWAKGKSKRYAYYRYFVPNQNFSKDYLEEQFCNFIDSFALDETCYDLLERGIHEKLTKKDKNAEKVAESIKHQLSELGKKQNDIFEKNYKGILSDIILKKQLERLEIEEMRLKGLLLDLPQRKHNYDHLIKIYREFLLFPGKTWRRAVFEMKLLYQKFVFPSGILFDGKEFRTPEICLHFQAKTLFLPEVSGVVNHSDRTSNTYKTLKTAHPTGKDELVWTKIGKELIELNEMIEEYNMQRTEEKGNDTIHLEVH